MKKFGYGVVVVSLFLERVPLLHPQVPINRLDLGDPWLLMWVEAMARHRGGGGPTMTYGSVFFHWL